MTEVVLDASAVIAQLRGEPGADQVVGQLRGAYLSAVNLAEIAQRLINDGASDAAALETLDDLPCKVVPLDEPMAIRAGLMRRSTPRRGLSIGDRACLALAEKMGLPVLTADRAWADLDLGVEIVLIR